MNKFLILLLFTLTMYLLNWASPWIVYTWKWIQVMNVFYNYFTTFRNLLRLGRTVLFTFRRIQEMSVNEKLGAAFGCLGLFYKFWSPISFVWEWSEELMKMLHVIRYIHGSLRFLLGVKRIVPRIVAVLRRLRIIAR